MNVFCTRKLESFISVLKKTEYIDDKTENWLCQIIYIDGKKCLFFIEKKTLYCVVLMNVQKKDLINIDILFKKEFILQLKKDNLFDVKTEQYIDEKYNGIKFYETDNDQKTLGNLKDNMMHLKYYFYDKSNKLEAAEYFVHNQINNIILGSRKYSLAKELMKIEIDNYHISN